MKAVSIQDVEQDKPGLEARAVRGIAIGIVLSVTVLWPVIILVAVLVWRFLHA